MASSCGLPVLLLQCDDPPCWDGPTPRDYPLPRDDLLPRDDPLLLDDPLECDMYKAIYHVTIKDYVVKLRHQLIQCYVLLV